MSHLASEDRHAARHLLKKLCLGGAQLLIGAVCWQIHLAISILERYQQLHTNPRIIAWNLCMLRSTCCGSCICSGTLLQQPKARHVRRVSCLLQSSRWQ